MDKFIKKHKDIIMGSLTCFDRIIFKGYLPINSEESMNALFDINHWLIKDFKRIAPKYSGKIKQHVQDLAEQNNRPFIFAPYGTKKEELARSMAEKDSIASGLVCVVRTLETCNTYKVVCGAGRPRLQKAIRKCNFFYLYIMDREFGLIHVRIQSWLPFPIQIYINGHDWLAQKMDRHHIGYTRNDNTFSWIEDHQRTQRFSDNLCKKNWPRLLEAFADLRQLTEPVQHKGHRARGLRPIHQDDAQLFEAVMRGEFLIKGFQNKHIVHRLFAKPARSKNERCKRTRKISYRLRILRMHRLIAKIPRSKRYRVTHKGIRLMASCIFLKQKELPLKLTA